MIQIEFFQDYKKVLNSDKNLITDFCKNQFETFLGNRHDQSIFSLLEKPIIHILEKETEFRTEKNCSTIFPY